MTVTCNCGHTVENFDQTRYVIYGGEDCDAVEGFHPCTFHVVYCIPCADQAATWPAFLPNQEAADEWLSRASDEHYARKDKRHEAAD